MSEAITKGTKKARKSFTGRMPVNQPNLTKVLREAWIIGDDTQLALNWDIATYTTGASTVDMSTNLNYLTLTSGGVGTLIAGWASMAANILRSMEPCIKTTMEIDILADAKLECGLYKDADELALVSYDASVGANFLLKVGNGSVVTTLDTGKAVVAGTEYKISLQIETDGKVSCWIDDEYFAADEAKLVTAAGHKLYATCTEQAAPAIEGKIGAFELYTI